MRAAAAAVADASVWSMGPEETAQALVELTRHEAQVAELKARVAAHADELHVGSEKGASSAAAWLAHETKSTRAAAHGAVRLGHDLEAHPAVRAVLAAGAIHSDQARVVIHWIDDLPDTVPADKVAQAEAFLLAHARHHDAKELDRLGRRLFEVIAPEEADAREAALLAKEEEAAARACWLKMRDDGRGKTHGEFTIPTFHGAALRKILAAIMAAKHQTAVKGAGAADHRPPTPEAMGQAFCEFIERYPVDRVPNSGGISATVVILMDLDVLLGRLEKACVLDTGEKISPEKPAGWRARPGSSPSCAAVTPSRWTSAAEAASTPRPNASPC